MMKRIVLCLIMILLCVISVFAQSRRKRQSSTLRASVITNIRQVDFKNFTYNLGDVGAEEHVPLRRGKYIITSGDNAGFNYDIYRIAYGDLTRDGKDEAIIVLGIFPVPGTAYSNTGLIYTIKNGRAALLAEFEGGDRSSRIIGIKVENGLLIVDRAELLGDDPPCCPEHYRSISYLWNGSRLTEVSRSSVKTINK